MNEYIEFIPQSWEDVEVFSKIIYLLNMGLRL